MKTEERVGNSKEPIVIKAGYEAFFAEMMEQVAQHPLDTSLGDALRQWALSFPSRFDLNEFDIDSEKQYERTYIGRDASGWEAIIMTWRKGRQSSIHGHPQFASYNALFGKLQLEIFEENPESNSLILLQTCELDENSGLYAIAPAPTMCNHIHRVSCISEVSYSLHIYSDDARMGYIYR